MIRSCFRSQQLRLLHRTAPRQAFLGDWFSGRREKKERKDLVEQQDEVVDDSASKIVILNANNSPEVEKFDASKHMPDFTINQWKSKVVLPKLIEKTYESEDLVSIINQTYQAVSNDSTTLTVDKFATVSLEDLSFRFKLTKELQKNLGFDINDLILSKSHNLQILFDEINTIVTSRFKNERNPNDIDLRPDDFTAPNIYINQELSEFEQDREFKKLVQKAKDSM